MRFPKWFRIKVFIVSLLRVRLTSERWQWLLPEIVIWDPDGWDRSPTNFEYQWYKERITIEVYYQRMIRSTCHFKRIKQ